MPSLLLTSLACALAVGVGATDTKEACETEDSVFLQFRRAPAAPSSTVLTSCISIRQQNLSILGDLAKNVSTPSNPAYGKFLTTDSIDELLAPAPADVKVVTDWLSSLRFEYTLQNDLVCVTSGQDVRKQEMPAPVAVVVAAIYSLSDPVGSDVSKPPLQLHNDETFNTPRSISEQYSTGNATVHRSSKNSQVIFSQGSFTATQATEHFFQVLPQAPFYQSGDANRFVFETAGGSRAPPPGLNCTGDSPSQWCIAVGEPTLDVQCIMGTAPGVQTRFFRLDRPIDVDNVTLDGFFTPGCLTLLNFVEYLLRSEDAPLSASISYVVHCDNEQIQDMEYRLAKLALKGVSVMAASGDSGAGGLKTVWPASSPWVTAVGGTMLVDGAEEAWSGSGGGFSNHTGSNMRTAEAPWQASAVKKYLDKLPGLPAAPPPTMFNDKGVGVPDVAAFAKGTKTCTVQGCGSGEGTSYASPTFAGIVALLNEARLAAKMPPMGCLNPFLYDHPEAFQDITVGSNVDGGTYGFQATLGWDPVTGLGTPNFEKLRFSALGCANAH